MPIRLFLILTTVCFLSGVAPWSTKPANATTLLIPSYDGSTSTNGRVSAFNGTSGQFLGTSFGPIHDQLIAITQGPDGLIYVSTKNQQTDSFGKILRYDPNNGKLIDTFISRIDGSPLETTFGPDGNLYVVKTGQNIFQILRFDANNGNFIDVFASGLSLPQDLAFGPDGNLYVSNSSGWISRFDGNTGAAIGTFSTTGLNGPNGLVFGPDGNLYVSGAFSENVVRYDPITGAFIDEFITAGLLSTPTDLIFGPDNNLYVNSRGANGGILRFDGQTGNLIDQFVANGTGDLGLITRGFLFITTVPEPTTLAIFAIGLATLAGLRRRWAKRY